MSRERWKRTYIKKTIIVVLVVRLIRRDINVVEPDVAGLLDTNRITIGSENLGNCNVANNNVLGALDQETKASEDDFG